jgi:pimeloyl-ACP methyl ester carboxylesterase
MPSGVRCVAGMVALLAASLLVGCDSDPNGADTVEETAPNDADGTADGDGTTDGAAEDAEDADDAGEQAPPLVDARVIDPTFRADDDCFGITPSGLEPDDVQCGTVEVPLHYDDPDGPTIDLAVARLAGSDPGVSDHPLVVLGGGPGEVMVEPFLTEPLARQLFDVGPDLILIDQRGVGSSRPSLACEEIDDLDVQDSVAQDIDAALEAAAACRDRLTEDGIDLNGFNHIANAHDVEMVRHAMETGTIDIRGTSYGTHLALLTAGLHPEHVRSLILSSPLDPRENWVEEVGSGLDAALGRVIDVCAVDERCSEQIGDLRQAIQETVDRLDEQPEEVTVQPPQGDEVTTTYGPAAFLNGLFTMFYIPDGVSVLPAMIDRARNGDLSPLAQIVAALEEALEEGVTTGMQLSMVCSAEAALADPDASLDGIESDLLREHWHPASLIGGASTGELCDVWDVDLAYSPGDVPLPTDTPTLLVTGAFDHVTPPRYGEAVAADLTTSHLVEVANAGHGPLESLDACGRQIAAEFLDDPTSAPDDSCAAQARLIILPELPGFG